jgi:multimeric flavodoxin WrbA
MKICVLNGNPREDDQAFEDRLTALVDGWTSKSHQVTRFDLRRKKIVSCTGCWTCWLKKPGLCAADDDTHAIRGAYIDSDLAVFASPLIRGFPSAVLKDVIDKLIPLILPYMVITNGECIHVKRYDRAPTVACLLQKEKDTGPEDLTIVENYFKRMAEQWNSDFLFSRLISDPVDEVRDELDRL